MNASHGCRTAGCQVEENFSQFIHIEFNAFKISLQHLLDSGLGPGYEAGHLEKLPDAWLAHSPPYQSQLLGSKTHTAPLA